MSRPVKFRELLQPAVKCSSRQYSLSAASEMAGLRHTTVLCSKIVVRMLYVRYAISSADSSNCKCGVAGRAAVVIRGRLEGGSAVGSLEEGAPKRARHLPSPGALTSELTSGPSRAATEPEPWRSWPNTKCQPEPCYLVAHPFLTRQQTSPSTTSRSGSRSHPVNELSVLRIWTTTL